MWELRIVYWISGGQEQGHFCTNQAIRIEDMLCIIPVSGGWLYVASQLVIEEQCIWMIIESITLLELF